MSNYDAVVQAVRSQFSYCNTDSVVEGAVSNAMSGMYSLPERIEDIFREYSRPSTVYQPKLFKDGNSWCALFGDNIACGVAGFGDSPANAFYDFDKQWHSKIEKESKV